MPLPVELRLQLGPQGRISEHRVRIENEERGRAHRSGRRVGKREDPRRFGVPGSISTLVSGRSSASAVASSGLPSLEVTCGCVETGIAATGTASTTTSP